MNVNEIVEFLKDNFVSILSEEEGLSVYCSPEGVSIRDLSVSRSMPMNVSDDFLKGVVFAKYDFFLKEVQGTKEDLNDNELEDLWKELGDVPFDDVGGDLILAEEWNGFNKGTEREDIWHWFDEKHSKGVAYLLNGKNK